jgi:Transposase and inactivated derivatives
VKYPYIQAQAGNYSIVELCRVLELSASGYYRWLKQIPSQHKQQDAVLKEKIIDIHAASKGCYGSPRIHQALRQEGKQVSRNRVIRLMKEANLKAKGKRKFKATTDSAHNQPIAANLVQQNFTVPTPNHIWVSDITYCHTDEGWLYLAVVIDLYSRKVIGWAMNKRMTRQLVIDALLMAYWNRKPKKKLFFIRIEDHNMHHMIFKTC